jgi:ribosomal protein S18 acetylase RimI-like enzyme
MSPEIRLARTGEAELVHRLTQQAFAEYRGQLQPPSSAHEETEAVVAAALAKGGALLALVGGTAVGAARFAAEGDHLYVGRVAVLPAWRGRGIAVALMLALEQHARRLQIGAIELGVRESLPSNVRLYEKLGYAVLRREPHPRNTDYVSLRMRKPVDSN